MTQLTPEAVASRSNAGDSTRERFYAEAGRFPNTETEFTEQKELLRQWRADSAFEPYWPLLDRFLARDFADVRKWSAAADAARQPRESGTYDFDAWREQREFDLKHANEHLL